MTAEGETWVWADGTIYDPAIPGYRQATVDELRRNLPREDCPGCGGLGARLAALSAAAETILARHGGHFPPGSWVSPGHDVIAAEWERLAAALLAANPSRQGSGTAPRNPMIACGQTAPASTTTASARPAGLSSQGHTATPARRLVAPGMECYQGRIDGCGHPTKTSGEWCPAGGACPGWEGQP